MSYSIDIEKARELFVAEDRRLRKEGLPGLSPDSPHINFFRLGLGHLWTSLFSLKNEVVKDTSSNLLLKKTKLSYHVVVYPKENEKEICEKIRLDILRHVDNVEGIWVVEEKED